MDPAGANVMAWLIFAIFNLSTMILLRVVLKDIGVRAMVQEKALPPADNPAPAANGAAAPQPPGGVPPAAGQAANVNQAKDNTSYSRVAGLIGTVILAAFFWAIGNVVLVKAFTAAADIPDLLKNIAPYFLSGSALFAPYAFNQLGSVFKS